METTSHICPVWIGYILANPLRKLFENPSRILAPYVRQGMKILEIGPAMGYFSIPLAKMTGKTGKVYCVDVQEKMLEKLSKRAERKGVKNEIVLHLANPDSQNIAFLKEQIDFCLLAHVVHEVPDRFILLTEVADSLKTGAKVLLIEPKGHVDEPAWKETLEIVEKCGFSLHETETVKRNRAMELRKL